ncbi:MAG: hypothetical protein PHC68_00595 [Syntrophorhabdaceae bacterium]|nr:hypothetical protein [Syntrophorhabdaceae bacterium]
MKNLFKEEAHLQGRNCYIDMWNRLPTPFKHRNIKTSLYKRTAQYFSQLEAGTFWTSKVIDNDWISNIGLSKKELDRRWQHNEIMRALRRLAGMYKEGNWPPNKWGLPTNLHDLLYNARSNKSMIFLVMKQKVVKHKTGKKEATIHVSDQFTI